MQIRRLGDCEIPKPFRKSKVVGSIPAGVDRFSGCENRKHGIYDYGACKRYLEHQFGFGILGKIKSRQSLASNERVQIE
ncbi:hypothetical protein TNCV_877051 [Trichonephila clavipes]|nr:hypothetical protein TNCV_877051 [Trichonephila clavipes]